eukprot:1158705-Pelagomonas_calceolata.AAC.21
MVLLYLSCSLLCATKHVNSPSATCDAYLAPKYGGTQLAVLHPRSLVVYNLKNVGSSFLHDKLQHKACKLRRKARKMGMGGTDWSGSGVDLQSHAAHGLAVCSSRNSLGASS